MRRHHPAIVLLTAAVLALACLPAPAAASDVQGQAGPGEQAASRLRLKVKPEKVEFDLSEPPGAFPPAPGQPVPVYVAPSRPAPGPSATLEIDADGWWLLYIQAEGSWGVDGLEVGDLFIAPAGLPELPPGVKVPPWPWMALSNEPRPLFPYFGSGEATLEYDLRLRIHGDEAPARRARLTLTYTVFPLPL